jgi:hypothetical protein
VTAALAPGVDPRFPRIPSVTSRSQTLTTAVCQPKGPPSTEVRRSRAAREVNLADSLAMTTAVRWTRRWLLTAPMWRVGLLAWFVGVPLVILTVYLVVWGATYPFHS